MLIGLTGAAGAGKATVGRVMCAAGYFSAAFHDALVIEVASMWGLDPRELTDPRVLDVPTPALAVGGTAGRDWVAHCAVNGFNLLQPRTARWLMNEWHIWRLARDPLHWIRHMDTWIKTQRRAGIHHLVVTDVASQDEAFFIRAHGGHVIRVHRPELPAAAPTFLADADIHNAGTLAHLSAEVWRVVEPMSDPFYQPKSLTA